MQLLPCLAPPNRLPGLDLGLRLQEIRPRGVPRVAGTSQHGSIPGVAAAYA